MNVFSLRYVDRIYCEHSLCQPPLFFNTKLSEFFLNFLITLKMD